MRVFERDFVLPGVKGHANLLTYFASALSDRLEEREIPIRFVVSGSDDSGYHCETAVIDRGPEGVNHKPIESIFRLCRRRTEHTSSFNAVLIVPTGIGAEIGGHAGDATPVARIFSAICDCVITHPNVVNASDINELPANALYVEGSVLARFMMGTVGLQPVRCNRILTIIDDHCDSAFTDAAINTIGAARSTYGLFSAGAVVIKPPIILRSEYSKTGRAKGVVEDLGAVLSVLEERAGTYDAVAVSSVVDVPPEYHPAYFQSQGQMVNPWGGVEAILTHALSHLLDTPTAHAPMFESEDIANLDVGVVDPRMAAEAISMTFLQCVLKGLTRSPKIVTDTCAMQDHGVLTAADISCLVIPDGCIGLPVLAALEQHIPVIAVMENKSLMKNDLRMLPWKDGQLHFAENYWEAVGIAAAMKAGLAVESVRRPLVPTKVLRFDQVSEERQILAVGCSNGKVVIP